MRGVPSTGVATLEANRRAKSKNHTLAVGNSSNPMLERPEPMIHRHTTQGIPKSRNRWLTEVVTSGDEFNRSGDFEEADNGEAKFSLMHAAGRETSRQDLISCNPPYMRPSMKKLLQLFLCALFACHAHAAPPYSEDQARALLTHLSAHVLIINSDLTLIKKKPASEFDLLTYYPLSKTKLDEYKRNGHIANTNDDIADFVTYKIKDYELTTEKNERLQVKEGSKASSLQDFALWTYDNVLCSQRGFHVKLDKPFERVKGHITLMFEMPGSITREIRIPINLAITDKDPRPEI